MHRTLLAVGVLFALSTLAVSQAPDPDPVKPDFHSPRPIDAVDSVMLEDMTWMEIRDAMRSGKHTVIVATGGIEQNGPYTVAGKHNIVLKGLTDRVARKLGDALVAPIVGFVPEGEIDPPSLHMFYPSAISVTEDTYQRLLTDICRCYKVHGFHNIILVGDSGGNQDGLKMVAEKLNAEWTDGKTRLHYIPEFYSYKEVGEWLVAHGIQQQNEFLHDDFGMSAQLAAIDPHSIRMEQRLKADKFSINGISLSPIEKTAEWGRKILDYRADLAVAAIRKAIPLAK